MKFLLPTICLILFVLPTIVAAQGTYSPLVNIPQLNNGQGDSFNGYINAVYAMFISIAALLAVVKIIVAGVKYMFSDIVTQKSEAKNDIKGALLGLVVVLAAVLILTVINPNLTNFDLDVQANPAATNRNSDETPTPNTDNERFIAGAYRQVCAVTENKDDLCRAEIATCEAGDLFDTTDRTGVPLRLSGNNNTVVIDCIPEQTSAEELAERLAAEREAAIGYARVVCNDHPDYYWSDSDDLCKLYTTGITEEIEIPNITRVTERDRLNRDLNEEDFIYICRFIVGDPTGFPLNYDSQRETCVQRSNRVEGEGLAPDGYQIP